MKPFLRLTALFALLVALTLAAGEAYVRSLPNPSRDKHAWMLAHSRRVRTLVLGSSHTFYGVDPAGLGPGAYSLAQVSQTYRYDDYLLRRYPTDSLRAVVLPFSYFSLYEDYELHTAPPHLATRYRLYMDCPYHPRLSRYGFEFMGFDAFKERLTSLWRPARLAWDSLGRGTGYTLAARRRDWDNGHARALANTYADHSAVTANLRFLESMTRWCRERGVRLVLVTTPVTASFRRAESPRQTALNRRALTALLRRHPEVRYLDFEADPRFVDADFYDADHLSDNGARKLTALVRREVE